MKRTAGFSLIELMVVVAIIGVLSTLALPRLNAYIARARSAEAQLGLDQIYKLQHSWRYGDIQGESYNNGGASPGIANSAWDTVAEAYGYRGSATWDCVPNRLGFRISECGGGQTAGVVTTPSEGRYAFVITAAAQDTFTAVAWGGAYDTANRIYPGCDDDDFPTAATPITVGIAIPIGDVWSIDQDRILTHQMQATQLCATD